MKTIQEQIAVMQHFAAGGKVKMQRTNGSWVINDAPQWDWSCVDYDIAEEADPYAELKKAATDPTKQIRLCDCLEWHDSGYPWHFKGPPEEYEIRDKPKPMKKVNLLAWFTGERLTWMSEEYSPLEQWRRVPAEDKEIEVEDE